MKLRKPQEGIFLGVDIGGTKCSVSLGRRTGERMEILGKTKFPTVPNDPEAVLQRTVREMEALLGQCGIDAGAPKAIGVSCGGPLDSSRGVILSPPNLPGWDCVPIVERLHRRFKADVFLQNDGNACALAEWKFGAGRGYRNLIFITFGTGFGAGLILDGRLYVGTNDMAGEIGHVRLAEDGPVGYGKAGSVEGFCSGGGIRRTALFLMENPTGRYRDSALFRVPKERIDAKVVADLAAQGDELCREIYRESGRRLGQGLSILIDILNPEIIIIGSIFARSHDLLWESTRESIEREALARSWSACRVVPSELGDAVGDYAALAVASSLS